jgi:uncharacterized membrane-anchored protein
MSRYATWLVLAGMVLVIGAANYTIRDRQQVVDNGQPILLKLRPVDPRSLMQGDYMVLRYSTEVFPDPVQVTNLPRRGAFIVKLDADNVATYSRLDDGGQLTTDEVRLKYKLLDENGSIRLGAESFFFEEGQAAVYDGADFGVLHVDTAGNSVLVGLADEHRALMRPADGESAN